VLCSRKELAAVEVGAALLVEREQAKVEPG
jgi:hypothetical protein